MDQLSPEERRSLTDYRALDSSWRATIRTAAEHARGLSDPGPEGREPAPDPRHGLRVVARDGRRA